MYMGGISRTLKLANLINNAGFKCTPHTANLSLVTVCTMHFLKAIANAVWTDDVKTAYKTFIEGQSLWVTQET